MLLEVRNDDNRACVGASGESRNRRAGPEHLTARAAMLRYLSHSLVEFRGRFQHKAHRVPVRHSPVADAAASGVR